MWILSQLVSPISRSDRLKLVILSVLWELPWVSETLSEGYVSSHVFL